MNFTNLFKRLRTSRYDGSFQSKRECQRRLRQIESGQLQMAGVDEVRELIRVARWRASEAA